MCWMNEWIPNDLLVGVQAEVEPPLYKCVSNWSWPDDFLGSFPSLRFCESVILGSPLTGKQTLPPWVIRWWPVLDLLDPWTHPLQEALLGSAGSLISSSRKGSVRNLWEELPGALRGSRDRVLRGSFKTFYKVKVCSKNKPTRLFKKLLNPYVHNTHFFEGPVSL